MKRILEKLQAHSNLFISFIAAGIFSFRWGNCLPFSGNMPALNDVDILAIYGRYLIFAKEPFGFPLALVHNLGFPFENTNIAKASIPLFAVPFKFFSKLYPPISEFYFSVLFEIVCVFVTAYCVCLLLRSFRVTSFWIKLLAVLLVCLSPALLYRSSVYYAMPFMVGFSPVYLAAAYCYIKLHDQPNFKNSLLLAGTAPLAALIDHYLLLGILLSLGIFFVFNAVQYILNNRTQGTRLKYVSISMICGLFFSVATLFVLDDQSNLKVPSGVSALVGRFDTNSGYGGAAGMGGGFHVADFFSVVIPPEDVNWKGSGPTSYFTKIGVPIKTAASLPDGEYEGFAYIGTTLICIGIVLVMIKIGSWLRRYRLALEKIKSNLTDTLVWSREFFSAPAVLVMTTCMLYTLSWGYVIHVWGHRLNTIVTPYLLLSDIYPAMMFARSPGRLAIPFVLCLSLVIIIAFDRYVRTVSLPKKETIIAATVLILSIAHINEVSGYLKHSQIVKGNDILKEFNATDRVSIRALLTGYKAVLTVPAFRDNLSWTKKCYALTAVSNIPISGASAALGTVTNEQIAQYQSDMEDVRSGNIKSIIERYGKVAFAAPPSVAADIVRNSDVPLQYNALENNGVVILTVLSAKQRKGQS